MNPTYFDALDRAIDAGGVGLAPAVVTGTKGKPATTLLAALVELGWFVKEGTKYTLTAEGRSAWEQHAPPERRAAVQAQEAAAQKERLLAFLQVVETNGKLTAKEAKLWAPTAIAAVGHYVAQGPKANTYALLPAGEMVLLAAKPVAEQLAALQAIQTQLASRWQAIHDRWREGLTLEALQPAGASITTQAQRALEALQHSTAAATAFEQVAQAATHVQQQLAEQAATVQAATVRLQELAAEQRAEVVTLAQEFAARLEHVRTTLATTPMPAPTVDLWEATRATYADLSAQASKIGGIVKVPELADAVRLHAPTLTHADYLQQLLAWERDDRLTLQVCNDRHLEPRAAEGITSPRGLLFYVLLR